MGKLQARSCVGGDKPGYDDGLAWLGSEKVLQDQSWRAGVFKSLIQLRMIRNLSARCLSLHGDVWFGIFYVP